jgi:hypothetical protein
VVLGMQCSGKKREGVSIMSHLCNDSIAEKYIIIIKKNCSQNFPQDARKLFPHFSVDAAYPGQCAVSV